MSNLEGAPEINEGAASKKKVGRRRVMTFLGSTGILASVGVFGGKSMAEASAELHNVKCCGLLYPPTSYATCHAHATYTWNCFGEYGGIYWECACCEAPGRSADNCVVQY